MSLDPHPKGSNWIAKYSDPNRSATHQSIKSAEDRVAAPSLLQRLFMPADFRRISSELTEIRDEQMKELAIEQIHAAAELKGMQLELDADRTKALLRNQDTITLGEQTRLASVKMVRAMTSNLAAENTWQSQIGTSECSDDDKEMLSQLAKGIVRLRNQTIASQHGVQTIKDADE